MGDNKAAYDQRVNRMKTVIELGQPDKVPVSMFFDGVITRFNGRDYRDHFYDYDMAGQSAVEFVKRYPNVDTASVPSFISGPANELAGTRMMDWPGRPGTSVSKYSTHQINEIEFLSQEEYPELLSDYTGFMFRKFIPRAFSNLQGTKNIKFDAGTMMNTGALAGVLSDDFFKTVEIMKQIAEENAKASAASMKYAGIMTELGYPGLNKGVSEAPYDILGDYFRGTMGIFEDLNDPDIYPFLEEAVDMFADLQIARIQSMKHIPLPLKACMFPLHKGMDGFMSDKQYERLYWQPLKKIIMALIDIDVTPFIYTEGPYNTRLEYFTDLPKGKALVHFEKVDMKRAKEIVGKTACISGNLSIANMEFGTKEQIINQTRELIDTCAPGGGYIFDFDGSLENSTEENLDAMFETLDKYANY